jgi:hypothetical protein
MKYWKKLIYSEIYTEKTTMEKIKNSTRLLKKIRTLVIKVSEVELEFLSKEISRLMMNLH